MVPTVLRGISWVVLFICFSLTYFAIKTENKKDYKESSRKYKFLFIGMAVAYMLEAVAYMLEFLSHT